MFQKILISAFLLGLVSCNSSDSSNDSNNEESIVGSWKATPVNDCSDEYQYNDDGTYEVHSRDEVTTGKYTVGEKTTEGLYPLSYEVLTDNEELSCHNETISEVGQKGDIFLKFSDKKVYIHITQDGPATFNLTKK